MADYPSSFDKDDLLKCARGALLAPATHSCLLRQC